MGRAFDVPLHAHHVRALDRHRPQLALLDQLRVTYEQRIDRLEPQLEGVAASGDAAQNAERIRELNRQGTTFLVVEHNMEFVMGLCDQVTVLDYGNAVVSGPPDVIRNDRRVLDAYLGTAEEDDDSTAA